MLCDRKDVGTGLMLPECVVSALMWAVECVGGVLPDWNVSDDSACVVVVFAACAKPVDV